jgi:hypothetical protein
MSVRRTQYPSSRYLLAGAIFSLLYAFVVVEGVRVALDTNNMFLLVMSPLSYAIIMLSEVLVYLKEGNPRAYVFGCAVGFGLGALLSPAIKLLYSGIAWAGAYVAGYVVSYLPSPYVINILYGILNALVIHYALYAFRSFVDGLYISSVVSLRKTPSLVYGILTPVAVWGIATSMVLSVVSLIYVVYISVVTLPIAWLIGIFTSILSMLGAYMIVRFVFTPFTNLLSNVFGELGDGVIVEYEDIEAGRPLYVVLLLLSFLYPFAGVDRYMSMAIGLSLLVVAGALSTVSSIAPVARRIRYLQQLIVVGLSTLGLVMVIMSGVATDILKYSVELALRSIGGVGIPLPF